MATATLTCEQVLALDCIVCGSSFSFTKARAGRYPRFCSPECKRARQRQQNTTYRPRVAHRCECIRCRVAFTASKPNAVHCSDACKAAEKRKRRKGRGYRRPPQRAYEALKRARKRAAYVERVDPFTVFDRDKWRCHLCGVKTKKALRGTFEPLAPELDHIVPLSQGGDHSYVNTACACRRCNQSKGDQLIGQMRLFG